MNTNRATATIVGVLCIIGTVAGLSSMAVTAGAAARGLSDGIDR